jgi:hypothetical protein
MIENLAIAGCSVVCTLALGYIALGREQGRCGDVPPLL